MPLYTYTDDTTGAATVRMAPVAERDRQPGLTRVVEFPVGRLGLAENPHTQDHGVRQGLKDMETKMGRGELQRRMGRDLQLNRVKQLWS